MWLSVHTPLSVETRKLLGTAAFDAAKPGLILINTARGQIVDLDALEAAMRKGTVAGAGLDVLPNEPGDLDHPLAAAWRRREPWIANRLIITPHAAFYSPASMRDLRLKSIEGRARLYCRRAAHQLRQFRISEMNMAVAQTRRLAVSLYARRLTRERNCRNPAKPPKRLVAKELETVASSTGKPLRQPDTAPS